jgi:hypothetical protein
MKQNENFKGNKASNKVKKYSGRRAPRKSSNPKNSTKDCSTNVEQPGDINNPAYYYEDANVLSQVMNFTFNQFGGVPVDMMVQPGDEVQYLNSNLMTIGLNPSVPVTTGTRTTISGATTAALRNFLMLSGSNAKATNYAPQDVILLELALAEVIKITTFCARAFGIAYMFNYRNRAYPEVLLRGMGINYVDFREHLAEYRIRFNTLMTLASKIPFPATIPAFSKAADLFGSIYLDDEDSSLAQSYMFVPSSTWVFDEQYDSEGSGLRTTPFVTGDAHTMDYYLSILENMISALLNSTTLNFIYSDIMRLVQNGKVTNLITFTSIPEDFNIVPVYNKEVETWLHNALLVGNPLKAADQFNPYGRSYTPSNDVSSDANNNTIKYWPQFAIPNPFGYEALIDFDHDNVDVTERVRATRFSQRWRAIANTDTTPASYYTDEIALNDHYITSFTIWSDASVKAAYSSVLNADPLNYVTDLIILDKVSKFDWHPILYFLSLNMKDINVIGDLDYYTLLDYHTIAKMYDYEVIHYLQIQ